MERVDIAIIGTGPAGISAAMNAKIRNKSFYLFGSNTMSDKVQKSELISNYPGIPAVTGEQLNVAFKAHLEQMEIPITEKRITGVYHMGDYFMLLADQEEFEAKTVIVSTGVEVTKPVAGEREFVGRGVSYCATCDGNLYRGKTIAVVCDNEEMEEEVEYLANLAGKVYYDAKFKNPSFEAENTERLSSHITGVFGERRVSKIVCRDGSEIEVNGVFFLKQSLAPAVLIPGIASENGAVVVDHGMRTNIPGCFACGDCTGAPYQLTKAVGEGNTAAHSAISYLNSIKESLEKRERDY